MTVRVLPVGHELDLLAAAVKRSSAREVARQLGVSKGSVANWLEGTSAPRAKACAVIRDTLGHKTETRSQNGDQVTKQPLSSTSLPLSRPGEEGTKAEATDHDDPRANAVATLKKLRALLEDVDPRSVPPVAQAITASSRLLAKLTGQIDVSETMLLRSMGWARIKTALVEAVRPYPEAARALAEAIEKISAAA